MKKDNLLFIGILFLIIFLYFNNLDIPETINILMGVLIIFAVKLLRSKNLKAKERGFAYIGAIFLILFSIFNELYIITKIEILMAILIVFLFNILSRKKPSLFGIIISIILDLLILLHEPICVYILKKCSHSITIWYYLPQTNTCLGLIFQYFTLGPGKAYIVPFSFVSLSIFFLILNKVGKNIAPAIPSADNPWSL